MYIYIDIGKEDDRFISSLRYGSSGNIQVAVTVAVGCRCSKSGRIGGARVRAGGGGSRLIDTEAAEERGPTQMSDRAPGPDTESAGPDTESAGPRRI